MSESAVTPGQWMLLDIARFEKWLERHFGSNVLPPRFGAGGPKKPPKK